jgi:hypothetical protein
MIKERKDWAIDYLLLKMIINKKKIQWLEAKDSNQKKNCSDMAQKKSFESTTEQKTKKGQIVWSSLSQIRKYRRLTYKNV